MIAADVDVTPIAMVGLVSCSAEKLDTPAIASELYTSPLFRKSLAYARQHCDVTYVLSAKHGLVELNQVIAPYDVRISRTGWEQLKWAEAIADELVGRHGSAYYLVLAGAFYADPLAAQLKDKLGPETFVAKPLAGMQIGERLSFLNAQIRRAS